MKRPIILMKAKDTEKSASKVDDPPIPTILIKTRDGENRAVSPQTSTAKWAAFALVISSKFF